MKRTLLIPGTVLLLVFAAMIGCRGLTRSQIVQYCESHPENCESYCEAHPADCQPYLGGQSGSGTGGNVGTGGTIEGTGGVVGTGGTIVYEDASPPEPDALADAFPGCQFQFDQEGCADNCFVTQAPTAIADKTLVKLEGSPKLYMVMSTGNLFIPITPQVAAQWAPGYNCTTPAIATPENVCERTIQLASTGSATVLSGKHIPPRPGTSILVLFDEFNARHEYVVFGYAASAGRTLVLELQPMSLEDILFPNGVAQQIYQPATLAEFDSDGQYAVGTPLTPANVSTYNPTSKCVKTGDVVTESTYLIPPPAPPPL